MPAGAEEGEWVHVYINVFSDDSDQDAGHDYNAHTVVMQAIKKVFPHLTKEFRIYDQGPHFKGTETMLNQRELGKHTGIDVEAACKEESGMGTGQVDKQCGLTKAKALTNSKYDIADGVDAHTMCISCDANGGVSGNMNVVMDAESMERPPKHETPLVGYTTHHNVTYNTNGSAAFHKSYIQHRAWTHHTSPRARCTDGWEADWKVPSNMAPAWCESRGKCRA
jgi:hypothetical protein